MASETIFVRHHRVVLRWRSPAGGSFTQPAVLQRVTSTALFLNVAFTGTYGPLPAGTHVTVEAPDVEGAWLAQFRGQVASVRVRQVEIRLQEPMSLVQRRAHPRVEHPFSFNTAVLLSPRPARYFLVHPVNISVGGIRLLHRMELRTGDRVRIDLRPREGVVISPTAEILECRPEEAPPGTLAGPPRYESRARFDEATGAYQRFLTRYIAEMVPPGESPDQKQPVEAPPDLLR